jgi:hypothetical protein
MNSIAKVLLMFAMTLLKNVANEVWDATVNRLLEAIEEAEAKWNDTNQGQLKKEWLISQVMAVVDAKLKAAGKPLAWLDRWMVQLAISAVADGVIKSLNDTLGRDWRGRAQEQFDKWAAALPVIE